MDEKLVILVVDDDPSIQSVVEEALSNGGFEPAVASSGEDALNQLKASKYRVLKTSSGTKLIKFEFFCRS